MDWSRRSPSGMERWLSGSISRDSLENSSSPVRTGWAGVVDSHPFRKGRGMDGAPAVFESGWSWFVVPQARFAARVPGPVRPVGGREVATPSQSRSVSAGNAGKVSVAEAELGWRRSGRFAVRMRLLGPEEVDGGQWHSTLEKAWKKFRAVAWQSASI